ncbi:hypothetical protein DFP73DRAFT_634511 [Morchella snyderi]|nr:hypothetical protein DFP73DRAFT_634511 [Morchella snyderi]
MARYSRRIMPKLIADETDEDNGKHDHVKNIPGDFNGHTRRSINADFRAHYKNHAKINNIKEESPKTEQTMAKTRVRPVSPKIPPATAGKEESFDSDDFPQGNKKEMKKEEEQEEEEENDNGDDDSRQHEEEGEEEKEEVEEPINRTLFCTTSPGPLVHTTSPRPVKYSSSASRLSSRESSSMPVKVTLTKKEFIIPGGDVLYPTLPNCESNPSSDSERASIFSEDISRAGEDTPNETDPDEFPEAEQVVEEAQEYEANSYYLADSSDEEPFILGRRSPKVTGKCEAIVPWGRGKRVIVSIGPAKNRKWRVQPFKQCRYSVPADLPEIQPRSRKSGHKATGVFGVAFKDEKNQGPEVIKVNYSQRIYVKIGWDDGTKTWERNADAKWLIERHITADMCAGEYLYKAAVAFEKKANKYLETHKEWGYNN